MAWYDEAIFYHIYPLGMTGAPKTNDYGQPVSRINSLIPWIKQIKKLGFNALYIGPLFESVGHGYETTDYKKLDSRLGTNDDLKNFVKECHDIGIKVVFDGVFNHTGRDFFAFKDIKQYRENSWHKDWYCDVNFWGNNEYNDGFCYKNWGGYNLLVKLNQRNPAVINYILDVIDFWVKEFDVDGIRLDAADVLDFDFMKALRHKANVVKQDFWLMGEVIHGDYNRWANEGTLHSVTNYHLHKALYSGHNDHNYFEIAHTVKRLYDMGGGKLKLYNFVDNHDVERIYTKLKNKAHFVPTHILLYTLPGIPSVYYGSEFGIEGKKERHSDDSLRPALDYDYYKDKFDANPCAQLISALGKIRQNTPALSYGSYKELMLSTRQYAFERRLNDVSVVVAVNNDDSDYVMTLPACNDTNYVGLLTGQVVEVVNGKICVNVKANSGDVYVPRHTINQDYTAQAKQQAKPVSIAEQPKQPEVVSMATPKQEQAQQAKPVSMVEQAQSVSIVESQPQQVQQEADMTEQTKNEIFEQGKIAGLQQAIISLMEKNGHVTEQMKTDVYNNTHYGSLITWIKSFR